MCCDEVANSLFHNAYAFADFYDLVAGDVFQALHEAARALAICPGHQQDPQTVEDEHEDQVHLGFAGCAFKFLPGKNSPESGDHRRGLPDGIRNCYAGKAGSNEIENHAGAPDESAEQSERVAGHGSAEKAGETHGLTDQWSPHAV